MARRVVYFVDNKVFFQCREDLYAEHLVDHQPRISSPDDHMLPLLTNIPWNLENPIRNYAELLMDYTKRALTDQKDVLRAMGGIIRRVSMKAGTRFFQGLPTAALDVFLLFQGDGQTLRRRQGFPSYSWIGWRGEVNFDRGGLPIAFDFFLNAWLARHTWILWYERAPSDLTSPLEETFGSSNPNTGCYRERRPFRPPKGLLGKIQTCQTRGTQISPNGLPRLDYPLLQFWTLTVHFSLRMEDVITGYGILEARDGLGVGEIQVDALDETSMFLSEEPLEFAVLSEQMCDDDEDARGYFIMLLEWNGQVAERRGVGTLRVEHIENGCSPGPQWKEILLG